MEKDVAIEPLAPEWDALATRLDAPPFLRPGWVSAWWEVFGEGRKLELIVRRDAGGELVGVLPLLRARGKLSSLANAHTPRSGSVAEERARQELFDTLFERRPRRVELGMLERDGPDLACARRAASGYWLNERVLLRAPYLAIEGDWDLYWRSRSKNLRKTVQRCRNRLRELGPLELDVRDGGEDLGDLLEESFRLEATGWKGARGTAIASRPETLQFYSAVAAWAAGVGVLRLAFLRIGGRAAAFNLSLETERVHYLVKMGHDAALSRAGPGTVLTAEMVQRAFALDLQSYEFLGGADAYKLRWAGAVRDLVSAQAFSPTAAGVADRLVQVSARRAARRGRDLLRRGLRAPPP